MSLRGLADGALFTAIPIVIAVLLLFAATAQAQAPERLVLAFYYTWFDERSWGPDQMPDQPLEPYVSRDRAVMARHIEPRFAIGTANAAEFFVSAAISAVFVATLGISHVHVVAGLLVGGVVAAPFAAWLTRRLPARPLMAAVGVLVVLLSLYNLLR